MFNSHPSNANMRIFSHIHTRFATYSVGLALFSVSLFHAYAAPQALIKARQSVPRICKEVESIRNLSFLTNITVHAQSEDAFRTYVNDAIDRQFDATSPEDYVHGLVRLGLFPETVDLKRTYMQLLEGQAAAHYDPSPKGKVYYILATNATDQVLDLISSHELCHALQDQHFDLYALIEGDLDYLRDNSDAAFARQALVEGEATLIMTIWMLMNELDMDDTEQAAQVASMSVEAQASMPLDDIIAMAKVTSTGLEGMDMNVDALTNAPRYLVQSMLSAYMQGASMVDHVFTDGGWEAINDLYKHPPTSSEQVLHPAKLLGLRDTPTPVKMQNLLAEMPIGWRVIDEDVVGELGIRTYIEQWDRSRGKSAYARDVGSGWDGDRYIIVGNDRNGKVGLVWKTVWDSKKDAREFATAYAVTLRERFPDIVLNRTAREKNKWRVMEWQVSKTRSITLRTRGAWVCIFDSDDDGPLSWMLESTVMSSP